jgi:NAD(P)-dependent dehydrogenase (short-subunit alcohol dehydrogenase family)
VDLGVTGQAFIIFGGTRGMGLAAASALAADGATLALVGRDRDHATTVAAELAGRHATTVVGIAADLAVEGAADAVVAEATDRLGQLRGAAITTGLGGRGQRGLLDASDDDWAATYEDVLMGTVRACRAVVVELLRGDGGAIVTTAAYSIRAPKAHQFPYASLKAAVATMTKDLAVSYGPRGIRANCVCPGATETDFLASLRVVLAEERGWPVEVALERAMKEDWGMDIALGRVGAPQEVGDVIAFLLSARAGYLTGATINVDGGTFF